MTEFNCPLKTITGIQTAYIPIARSFAQWPVLQHDMPTSIRNESHVHTILGSMQQLKVDVQDQKLLWDKQQKRNTNSENIRKQSKWNLNILYQPEYENKISLGVLAF